MAAAQPAPPPPRTTTSYTGFTSGTAATEWAGSDTLGPQLELPQHGLHGRVGEVARPPGEVEESRHRIVRRVVGFDDQVVAAEQMGPRAAIVCLERPVEIVEQRDV